MCTLSLQEWASNHLVPAPKLAFPISYWLFCPDHVTHFHNLDGTYVTYFKPSPSIPTSASTQSLSFCLLWGNKTVDLTASSFSFLLSFQLGCICFPSIVFPHFYSILGHSDLATRPHSCHSRVLQAMASFYGSPSTQVHILTSSPLLLSLPLSLMG